jgi:hypothetical protein
LPDRRLGRPLPGRLDAVSIAATDFGADRFATLGAFEVNARQLAFTHQQFALVTAFALDSEREDVFAIVAHASAGGRALRAPILQIASADGLAVWQSGDLEPIGDCDGLGTLAHLALPLRLLRPVRSMPHPEWTGSRGAATE